MLIAVSFLITDHQCMRGHSWRHSSLLALPLMSGRIPTRGSRTGTPGRCGRPPITAERKCHWFPVLELHISRLAPIRSVCAYTNIQTGQDGNLLLSVWPHRSHVTPREERLETGTSWATEYRTLWEEGKRGMGEFTKQIVLWNLVWFEV